MSNKENQQSIREHYIYDPATKQRIPVSDEIYNEFYRPIWNTFRKAHRHGTCSCPGSKWWLCGGDCAVCKYRTAGDSLSLDYELEVIGDIRSDDAAPIDEIVTDSIAFGQLLSRLDKLMPEARLIGELRLSGLTDGEISEKLGIPRTTMLSRLKKAKAQLHSDYDGII